MTPQPPPTSLGAPREPRVQPRRFGQVTRYASTARSSVFAARAHSDSSAAAIRTLAYLRLCTKQAISR
jgi:hypothetical protein